MKKIILIISSLFACVGLFSFIHFLNSPVRDVTSKAEMIQTDEIKMEYVPTKNQLLKSIGDSVDFLGIYEVTEINFNDTPHIVLTKEDENELSFEIRVTDPKEQSFSIPAIKFSPQNIHVSDTFGIAKKMIATLPIKTMYPLKENLTTHADIPCGGKCRFIFILQKSKLKRRNSSSFQFAFF